MLHVLFVCEHNSARSQMAEAFLKRLGGEDFAVESCGLEAGILNQQVVEVMNEIGYDLRGNTTQAALDLFRQGRSYDVVITVCSQKASELARSFLAAPCGSIGPLPTRPAWRETWRPNGPGSGRSGTRLRPRLRPLSANIKSKG